VRLSGDPDGVHQGSAVGRRTAFLSGFLGLLLALGYPFVVYVGLTHLRPRLVATLVLASVVLGAAVRLRGSKGREFRTLLAVPAVLAVLLGIGAITDHRVFVMGLPVATNALLLLTFAGSLRGPMPIIERFARLQHEDLTAAEQRYCRTVTHVWCGFFAVNGLATLALSIWAPLALWTLYTGVLAYAAMGTLFAVEYVVRKYRFRRFGPHLHDRILVRLLPRSASPSPASSS